MITRGTHAKLHQGFRYLPDDEFLGICLAVLFNIVILCFAYALFISVHSCWFSFLNLLGQVVCWEVMSWELTAQERRQKRCQGNHGIAG